MQKVNRQQRQRRNAGFSAMRNNHAKANVRGPQAFKSLYSVSREPVVQIHKMGTTNPRLFQAKTATTRGRKAGDAPRLVMRHNCAFVNTRHGSKAERNADLDSIFN